MFLFVDMCIDDGLFSKGFQKFVGYYPKLLLSYFLLLAVPVNSISQFYILFTVHHVMILAK